MATTSEELMADVVKSLVIQVCRAQANAGDLQEQVEHLKTKLEEERAMRHKLEEEKP